MIQNQGGADLGGITIKKVTNSPDSSIEFEFSQTVEANIGGDFPDFKLTKDGEKPFSNVAPGIYEVTETNIPSPYSLDDITCVDPDGDNSIVDVGAAMATINLSPNEAVICTFTNNDTSLPVTLGWILAEADGDVVDFRWQTATETGTAGFNTLAVTERGTAQPTDYAFSAVTDDTSFLLQEVEITGALNLHGPFMIGVEGGAYSGVDATGSHQIWLPLMMR